jgi:hypothetical protein
MRKLNSLMDANLGDVILFRYDGGSNPGKLRQVEVTAKTFEGIGGTDKVLNQYRSFLDDRAYDINLCSSAPTAPAKTKLVSVSIYFIKILNEIAETIKSCRLNGEQLAKMYSVLIGKECTYNSKTASVEYQEEVKIPTVDFKSVMMAADDLKKSLAEVEKAS